MKTKMTTSVRTYSRYERRVLLHERRQFLKQNQRNLAQLRSWLAMVSTWPNRGTFPGMKDGDRKADEFVRLVRKMIEDPFPLPWRH